MNLIKLGLIEAVMYQYDEEGKLSIDMLYFFKQLIAHVNNQIFSKKFHLQDSFSVNPYNLTDFEIKEVMKDLGFNVSVVRTHQQFVSIKIISKL